MRLAYKVQLNPTAKQVKALFLNAAVRHKVYNWALTEWNSDYQKHKDDKESGIPKDLRHPLPSYNSLSKRLNQLKNDPTDPAQMSWITRGSKCSAQEAIRDLEQGWRNFFNNRGHFRRPRKKTIRSSKSFRVLSGSSIKVTHKTIYLPTIGLVKFSPNCRGQLPLSMLKNVEVTVSQGSDSKWYVSYSTEIVEPQLRPNTNEVGIDIGISKFVTFSDGSTLDHPRPLKKALKKIKRLQRNVSRKKKGSKNCHKAKTRLRKKHNRVANIRKDCLHKTTNQLTKTYTKISVEDLKIKNMTASRKGRGRAAKARLNRSLSDIAMGEFIRQLTYKGKRNGCEIKLVNPAYTSQKCSACGFVHKDNRLTQSDFKCLSCGFSANADHNAAMNIYLLGH